MNVLRKSNLCIFVYKLNKPCVFYFLFIFIDILSGKVASIQWRPPSTGGYSGFKLKVIPLSEPSKSIRNIVIREDASPFQVNNKFMQLSFHFQKNEVMEVIIP